MGQIGGNAREAVAYRWRVSEAGVVEAVELAGLSSRGKGSARAINNNGKSVGWSGVAKGKDKFEHAVLWEFLP